MFRKIGDFISNALSTPQVHQPVAARVAANSDYRREMPENPRQAYLTAITYLQV